VICAVSIPTRSRACATPGWSDVGIVGAAGQWQPLGSVAARTYLIGRQILGDPVHEILVLLLKKAGMPEE
jgi:hypothetical protein